MRHSGHAHENVRSARCTVLASDLVENSSCHSEFEVFVVLWRDSLKNLENLKNLRTIVLFISFEGIYEGIT